MSILERDFRDTESDDKLTSQEDMKFLQIMNSSTKQNAGIRFIERH